MIHNNLALYGAKILSEIVLDILLFPVWWYSQGIIFISKKFWQFLVYEQKSLALTVWLKNIAKPMYGQNDWQGILISFFMRLFQIFFRSLIMLLWISLCLLLLLLWIALPFYVVYQAINQII